MIDINLIRNNAEMVKKKTAARGVDPSIIDKIKILDEEWRAIKKKADNMRAEVNKTLKQIAINKKQGKPIDELIKAQREKSRELKQIEEEERKLKQERDELLLMVPNLVHDAIPIGEDETQNVEIRKWGKITKQTGDEHYVIGEKLGMMDFTRGVKLGGHRFTVLWDKLAKLERALINFMLDFHTKNGYTELWLPHLVKRERMIGSGQLPKFEEDLYSTKDDLYLIPTAEVSLVNLHANEIFEEHELPKRYMAYTPCYRREAGAYGKDIKGMLRQHQFDKVELVHFCTPEKGYEHLEEITHEAEQILQALNIPYRVIELCSGDIGFASAKTYDLELWLPGQEKYREVSSCSTCTDFQARRANIKYRKDGKLEFVHTLNGSGIAVGRTLIGILENYAQEDGVEVPEVLRNYAGFDFIHYPRKG